MDLELWLDKKIIQRQNLLKAIFKANLEEVGNSISLSELEKISPVSRGIKLSKGNDLLGYPYFALDLIRDFDLIKGINIRLLNWFGHGFFITVLLGEKSQNPLNQILELGFSYGLSEGKWDYPDLILNQNLTKEQSKIITSQLGFHHYIKELKLDSTRDLQVRYLVTEIKNLLGILSLPAEGVRI